ncbi:MAG: GNAT family N-acetyltransferase [Oscillospiraceae bacterium]|nr:GNAT family N-acetyltransferase [Oscillospiraceae bacterium]
MSTVSLQPMTREMCHEFYKCFQNDPAIGHYYEYIYTPEIADHYFDTNSVPDRRMFAILTDGQIVGECKLKYIDMDKRECSMGIHLRDDSVKEKGYGTQAERLILQYAFEELGMIAVNADAALKNTRSQHVLEKVGFRYTHEDDTFKYYRCERVDLIRRAEAKSHIEAYTSHLLFSPGSWLAKPVKTVMELLPLFEGYTQFAALDLGSGVGRNSIPVAQYFSGIPCRVECVDILELAIAKLNENALQYGVADCVQGIVSSIDDYEIDTDSYDLILAVSALEHIASQSAFEKKLAEIRDGLRYGGIACLIVNSGVVEHDKATGQELPPQFEVNLPTSQMQELLEKTFAGWKVIKHTIVHQKYDIPREKRIADLETDVITYVVRKG